MARACSRSVAHSNSVRKASLGTAMILNAPVSVYELIVKLIQKPSDQLVDSLLTCLVCLLLSIMHQ